MIAASNVSKHFGKFTALNNISIKCNKGQTISLIGPNGSGKTTLIKCLLGMVIPDKGFITFNDQNILHNWVYRAQIGYMPQTGKFPENMRIAEVMDMMIDIRRDNQPERDEELMEEFGLEKIKDKRMRTLSGGTRQKVSASLAFMFNPQVLILDEPTAGLDPLSSEVLKNKIRREKEKGKLILVTSHILSDLDDITSEVVYMQEGKIMFHKSITDLRVDTGEERLGRAIAHVMRKNCTV
jgi:Cu-processing system ATP-binding protein